jgi:MoxR-like ATPases
LPADVVGTLIFNQQQNSCQVRKGPIFANSILADEINGAPAKVQSDLLEASQERPFIQGRGYVIPEDARAVCMDVMRHRVGLTYEAEAQSMTGEQIVNEVLNAVEVP